MQSPEEIFDGNTPILPVLPVDSAMDVQEQSVTGQFHPLFASPEGDVVLSARGGQTYFRVHSYTLKTTSGFFRAMYNLPQ